MNITDLKHIAIIQTAFLGDVALTLPLADEIRRLNPTIEITFVTTPTALTLAESSLSINNVLTFDKRKSQKGLRGILSLTEELQFLDVDCIIAPHRSLRTSLLTYFTRPKCSVGFSRNALSFLYSKTVEYPAELHEVERNIMLLSVFDDVQNQIKQEIEPPKIKISIHDLEIIDQKIRENKLHAPIIALAPGSVWATKRWCEEYYILTAQSLLEKGYSCVFIGGNEDRYLCSRLALASGAVSIAGETSIVQSIALLSKCSALLTNDSAPTHLAWIAGCPTATIFGATSPKFGFAPRGDSSVVLQNDTLGCRPCAIHGGNRCPLGTLECMKSVRPERVSLTIESIVAK